MEEGLKESAVVPSGPCPKRDYQMHNFSATEAAVTSSSYLIANAVSLKVIINKPSFHYVIPKGRCIVRRSYLLPQFKFSSLAAERLWKRHRAPNLTCRRQVWRRLLLGGRLLRHIARWHPAGRRNVSMQLRKKRRARKPNLTYSIWKLLRFSIVVR